MAKDLRTGVEVGNVQGVLDGDLDEFIDAYLQWRRATLGEPQRRPGWGQSPKPRTPLARPRGNPLHENGPPLTSAIAPQTGWVRGATLREAFMIRVQDVSKVYDGGTIAVRDVTLEINKGEFVFLVGPSGSGKSTLIRLMLRQELPSDGKIWVAGKLITELPAWKIPLLRRSIGTVFQDFKLLPTKTVFENVAFCPRGDRPAPPRHP